MNPPCNSHAIHCRMFNFGPENVTSFAETDSSNGDKLSVAFPLLHSNLYSVIVVEEQTVTRVECLEAASESNDEEEVINVVGKGEVGVRSGIKSEVFKFVDALRPANLVAASDPKIVLDTSGMPICNYF